MTRKRGTVAACLLLAAGLLAGCLETEWGVRRTLEAYLDAVHKADVQALSRLSVEYLDLTRGKPESERRGAYEEFERRASQRLAAYEAAKETGQLDLGADGVGLIKGMMLGRGVFYQLRDLKEEADRARVRIEVNLGYNFVPFENYAEGTRIFMMGMPVGRLIGPVRGQNAGQKIEVLARLELEVDFQRDREKDHPTGWRVRSFSVVPGSERGGQIEWR
jgi:hypothetical protein